MVGLLVSAMGQHEQRVEVYAEHWFKHRDHRFRCFTSASCAEVGLVLVAIAAATADHCRSS